MVRQVECRGREERDDGSIPRRFGDFSHAKSVGAGVYECKINFGPELSCVFWERRRADSRASWWWYKATPAKRHQTRARTVGRLQTKEEAAERERRGMNMALTRDFRETVQARVKRDAAFRKGLLSEAIESLLSGEVSLGKELLRDYINATVGFPKLAARTKIHVKTLHQMFGPNGNPTARNLFEIVAYLQHAEGVRFEVRSTRAAFRIKRSSPRRRKRRDVQAGL